MIKKILLLSAITLLNFSCNIDKNKNFLSLNLSGEWDICYENKSNLNHSKNEKIILPGSWIDKLDKTNMTSIVSLKKRILITEKFRTKLLLLQLGEIGVADETFINGIKIGATGLLPSNDNILKYNLNWLNDRKYFIPSSLIKYDKENLIEIKIFSHIINGINGKLKIIEYNETYLDFNITNFLTRHLVLLNVILALILAFLLKLNRKNKTIFLGTISLIGVAIAHFLVLGVPQVENGLLRFQIFTTVAILGYYFFMLVLQDFYSIYLVKTNIVATILLIISLFFIIFSPNTHFLYYKAGLISHISMAIFTLISFAIYFLSLKKDFKRYWILSPLSIYLQFSTFSTFYYLFNGQHYEMLIMYMSQIPLILTFAIIFLLFDMNLIQNRISFYNMLLFSNTNDEDPEIVESKKTIESKNKILQMIKHIDENYHNNYDRVTLATKFSMNEYYMGQLFKKETGKNISSYINEKRINKAKELLIDTDGKIIDIAFHVGFENTVHFHREFKKNIGVTPKQFRIENGK